MLPPLLGLPRRIVPLTHRRLYVDAEPIGEPAVVDAREAVVVPVVPPPTPDARGHVRVLLVVNVGPPRGVGSSPGDP